jgi:hypothetical protein
VAKSFKTPSIVSVDSILQDKPDTSSTVQGASYVVKSRAVNMAAQVELGHRRRPARTEGLVKPMVRLYDIPNTSSKMEMLHFWCVLFGHASDAMPNLSITLYIN